MTEKLANKLATGLALAFCFLLMVTSCEPSNQKKGKDNYYFDQKEYQIENPEILFVFAKNATEWAEHRKQFDLDEGFNAFSVLTNGEKPCIINAC